MTKFSSQILTVALGVTLAGVLAYVGSSALNYYRTKNAESKTVAEQE